MRKWLLGCPEVTKQRTRQKTKVPREPPPRPYPAGPRAKKTRRVQGGPLCKKKKQKTASRGRSAQAHQRVHLSGTNGTDGYPRVLGGDPRRKRLSPPMPLTESLLDHLGVLYRNTSSTLETKIRKNFHRASGFRDHYLSLLVFHN